MVTRLREGVWWIDLGGVNGYLVDDGGDLTLVDAGMPWHGDDVVGAVLDAGYALSDLKRVLVTHYDLDHVGGLPRLDGLDVDIYAGRGDAPLVAGHESPSLRSRKGVTQRVMGLVGSRPNAEVTPVVDGDTLGSFTVYETPGHTPGHVAYVSESLDAAFLGDLVREADGALDPSPWLISDDTDAVRESIHELRERAPPFATAAVGHGTPFERGGSDRLADLARRI